ncbi:hypothetical protein Btru_023797 [Bulinus truncatus]|nr:hypothetical protein Btru_023797 [Bulinus truncatus]
MIRNKPTPSVGRHAMLDNQRTFQDSAAHENNDGGYTDFKSDVTYSGRRKNLSDHLDVFVSNQLIPYDNPSPRAADLSPSDGYQQVSPGEVDVLPDCPLASDRPLLSLAQGSDDSRMNSSSPTWYSTVSSFIPSSSPYQVTVSDPAYARANSEPFASHADHQRDSYLEISVHDNRGPEHVKTYKTDQNTSVILLEQRRGNGFVPATRSVSAPYDGAARDSGPNEGLSYDNGRLRTISVAVRNRDRDHTDSHPGINSVGSPGVDTIIIKSEGDSDYSETSSDQYFENHSSSNAHQNYDSKSIDHFSNGQNIRRFSSASSVLTQPLSGPDGEAMESKHLASEQKLSEDESTQSAADYRDGAEKSERHKSGKHARGAQNLPPCRVCGNKASGLHFGVNTCEACNEFFRRSLKRGASYYCTKNRECQVYGKKRNACSYCRYRRCVDMGMSRDAIKTGRYSHKTRTEYAMEVEEFRQKEMHKAEKEKFEVLLKDLVLYHDKYVKNTTRLPDDVLLKHQSDYLQLYTTQKELELRHPPLTSPMLNKKLLNDSNPVSEDLSLTMHDVEMTEKWLRNYINYAKNVPGFKELALSDQASLVRGTWFEFWFLGAFRGYNSDLHVVYYPNGRTFHEEEIMKVFGKEYTDFSFSLADRMASLQVTPEEMVLIKTVCLTFPDRTALQNRDDVERMHWLMVSCLLHTLEKNRPGDSSIFPLIVSKLVELRTLTDIAMRAHKSAIYQDVLKESPLLSEMVDTKTIYVNADAQGKTVSRMPVSPLPV